MPTLRQLIASVRHRLAGVGSYTDAVMELTAELSPGSTSITVDDAASASAGVYEIGLEKVRVKSVDRSAGTLMAYSFGRGYEGTTQTLHNAGSEITRAPIFPASTVAQEINGVLTELYPHLYGVKTVDLDYVPPFALPSDAVGVIAVFQVEDGLGGYRRLDGWRWEPSAGKGLLVHNLTSGQAIRVVYATRIGLFDLSNPYVADVEFVTATGLDSRIADLLTLGVAYRLAPYADMGNLLHTGAEARADSSKPPGRGASLARLLYAEFQQRLVAEQQVLAKENPIRVHRERV